MFIVKRSDGQGLTRNYATKGWSKWIALSCACEQVEHLSHQRGRSRGLARPLLWETRELYREQVGVTERLN